MQMTREQIMAMALNRIVAVWDDLQYERLDGPPEPYPTFGDFAAAVAQKALDDAGHSGPTWRVRDAAEAPVTPEKVDLFLPDTQEDK